MVGYIIFFSFVLVCTSVCICLRLIKKRVFAIESIIKDDNVTMLGTGKIVHLELLI